MMPGIIPSSEEECCREWLSMVQWSLDYEHRSSYGMTRYVLTELAILIVAILVSSA